MIKIITPLLISLFLCSNSYSQPVTLRDSGLVLVSNDTTARIKGLSIVSSVGQALTNGIWDLSQASYFYPMGYYPRQAPFAGNNYPAASYSYRGATYYGQDAHAINNYYSIDSTGIEFIGQNSFVRQAFSRKSVTGNSNDSLVFPAQSMPLSPSLKRVLFPATMGSVWGGSTSHTTQFFVYSAVGNLVNAPMSVTTSLSIQDTVVGWGKMRVRLPDSMKISEYVPVLQVHAVNTEIDSFYMNGAPVADSILNYLGLVQGSNRTTYFTTFFRAGEIEPLLSTLFVFPDHWNAIYSSVVLTRLPVDLQASTVPHIQPGRLSVYPNPARTRQLNISWPGASGTTLHYSLTNFGGSRVAAGTVALNESLKLQDSVPAGLYCLTLLDSNGDKESVPLMLE